MMYEDLSIPMPITQEARQTAKQFADQQHTPQKAEKVYLNTLAVYMVNNYLRLWGISANLTESDSWNPSVRLFADVADLQVADMGKLECLPLNTTGVRPQVCYIPEEVQCDRIGYVVVEIDDEQQQANLLGFVDRVTTSQLPINKLQSMDKFLEYLSNPKSQNQSPAILSQWFQGMISQGWQSLETFFNTEASNLTPAFRNNSHLQNQEMLQQGKLIDLAMPLGSLSVLLLLAIIPAEDEKISIRVQLHPAEGEKELPANIKLVLLSEGGDTLTQVSARSHDNLIQLPLFKCNAGERFSVQVCLADFSHQEDFAI